MIFFTRLDSLGFYVICYSERNFLVVVDQGCLMDALYVIIQCILIFEHRFQTESIDKIH